MKLYNSTHNFFRADNYKESLNELIENNRNTEISKLKLVKNEEFGFFASFNIEKDSFINLNDEYDLPWWGLDNRYRIRVESEINATPHLIGYVKDDDEIEKADIILKEKSGLYPKGEVPIFIEGKIPEDFNKNKFEIKVELYSSNGYEKEKIIDEQILEIEVINFDLDMNIDNSFFLDLWQHPSSWARAFGVDYFSEEHFGIIEKYIKEMSKLGQKVIDLIVSDFPWAGQMCFAVEKNPSRLYEYNIVEVKRKNGKLKFNFKNMDRYIDICMNNGIKDEINIFGIIGNWHGYDFGSPLVDYNDSIRIKVLDEDEKVYDFIRNKKELMEYIKALFNHLDERNLLGITKVIGDEPGSNEAFKAFSKFLEEASGRNLSFKYALHSDLFFKEYEGEMESFSMNTLLLGDSCENGKLVGKLGDNSEKMTWYSCCFPEKFNIFIKSPLIESRYIGPYTYIWNLKGMLRWAYGIYVEDVYKDITYKSEKWAAGDMVFAYPGKNGNVVHSLREKNMLYSIQDFNIFKKIESKDRSIKKEIEKFGISGKIENINGKLIMDKYKDINEYIDFRNRIIESKL